MAKIMLLGAPGAGKGTVAERIVAAFGIPVIATGDIFRKNLAENTPLGLKAKGYMEAGELVPDELVIDLVADRLAQDDTKNGYLLDGFPRTTAQAEALDALLTAQSDSLDKVFYINVPKDVLVDRIAGRRVCPKCGKVYHVRNMPPKQEGICDVEGEPLIQRKDDDASTAENRIDVYNEQTKPLVDYYDSKGLLIELDGTAGPEKLMEQISENL